MPAQNIPKNSVWTAMSYTPPRGRCNFKNSLMSPACPCLRFMLHPVKAATSFDCDGCGHHASFHSMENVTEDAVVKKWAEEEQKQKANDQASGGAGRKRRRIANHAPNESVSFEVLELEDGEETEAGDAPGVFPGAFPAVAQAGSARFTTRRLRSTDTSRTRLDGQKSAASRPP